MSRLRLVGGIEVDGEGPPVWEDESGVERVLRDVAASEPCAVVVIAGFRNGRIVVHSTFGNSEASIGIMARAQGVLVDMLNNPKAARDGEKSD